jgi:hypothetical protein
VQPPAVVSVCQRRSRASITAMTTSSRCKPSPQHQWRPWPRSCACVPWGDHGFMPESASWCGGECAGAARQQHSADGRTLCRTRGARACGTARRCVAHQSCQSDLRSTPTIGTARGAGPPSIIGMQPQRPRCAARQVNKRTHSKTCQYVADVGGVGPVPMLMWQR